jgi:RNA polymerase sigma factor (sigma-70 family)
MQGVDKIEAFVVADGLVVQGRADLSFTSSFAAFHGVRAMEDHKSSLRPCPRPPAVGLVAVDANAEVANVVSEDEDPLAAAEQSDTLRRLAECLNKLDKNRRDMVVLAYRDGYSRQELSQRLARPVGTIKTWLHHSLIQLKACLGQ